jgi:hypothetical protein
MVNTVNRNYPMPGGLGNSNVGQDLASIKAALVAIDADVHGLQTGGSVYELPPTGPVGGFLQKLATGTRWTNVVDGGNALGVVSLPASGYVPVGGPNPGPGGGGGEVSSGDMTVGSTTFEFSGSYTAPANTAVDFAF